MQIEKIERIVKGYIKFTVTDGFAQTFFYECKKRDVSLFNVSSLNGAISAVIKRENLSLLYECARKAGMEVHIVKKAGLPYLVSRYRFRVGIPVGFFVGLFIFLFLTSVVWSIEISGNETIREYEIIKILNEQNVKVGSFTENVDCKAVEIELERQIDNIMVVVVNIFGSKIFIDITERIAAPEITDEKQYTNLIAAEDGEIVRFDVFEGDGVLGVGYPVVKGDLLVSGVETLKDNTVRYVHAKALVIARTSAFISTSTALNFNAKKISKCSDRYLLYLFGVKIPLAFAADGARVYENKYLADTKNTVFPLGLIRETTTEAKEADISLNEECCRLICLNDLALNAFKELSDAVIVNVESSCSISNEIKIEAIYICEKNICEELIFEVEEQGEI